MNLEKLKVLLTFVESADSCKGVETIKDAAIGKDVALPCKNGQPMFF